MSRGGLAGVGRGSTNPEAYQRLTSWAVMLGAVAIIFNPIIPVYLTRAIWAYIDLPVAALLIVHMFAARRGEGGFRDRRT
jgi:hypothetical protein